MFDHLKQLTNTIKDNGETIYSISTKIGIDRSYLSKMLSGKRPMSMNVLGTILEMVCDSTGKREEIINLYIREVFGQSKFEKYCNYLSSTFITKIPFSEAIPGVKFPDYLEFDSRFMILYCAANMMSQEKASSRIYTNFPLLDFLEIAKRQHDCDFRCVISSSTKDKNTTVFDHMKLVLLNGVCYSKEDDNGDVNEHDFFPYLLIVDDGILFANDDLESGYYIRNNQLADFYARKFISKCKQSKACSLVHNNILEIKDTIEKFFNNNIAIDRIIETHFSVTFFMELEDWEELARDDLPEKEYLKTVVYNHYKSYYESMDFHDIISTKAGLMDFCENGTIYEVPTDYCKPLSTETKIAILERMRANIKENPEKFSQRFIKQNNPDKIDINLYIETLTAYDVNQGISLHVSKKDIGEQNDIIGKYCFFSTDKSSIEEYNEFFDLFKMSNMVMSLEESVSLLDDAIARLKLKIETKTE